MFSGFERQIGLKPEVLQGPWSGITRKQRTELPEIGTWDDMGVA